MKRPLRKYQPYPSDVSDEEWSFVAPYLVLNRLDGENRRHDLRAVFNPLRWLVRIQRANVEFDAHLSPFRQPVECALKG